MSLRVDPEKVPPLDEVFREIAAGNQEAHSLCVAVFNYLHLLDDLVDKDRAVSGEQLVKVTLDFAANLAFNAFFQARRAEFLCLLRTAALAWLESETLAASTEATDQFVGGLLKSQYQDLFFEVAFWVGGWDHAREMARKYRMYFPDVGLPSKGA